jgi:hypothetical protein
MIAVDPDSGELVGGTGEVTALIDGGETVGEPAVDAALAAARDPAFTIWTEGYDPAARARGDRETCALVTDRPDDRRALLPLATDRLPVALAVWLDLGPRPVLDHPPIRLDPGAMAILIGRGEAHGRGLEPELARDLQARLDAGVRHWTVCVATPQWRRNLEVVEGDGGIWRVRPVEPVVELAPTSSTAVMRELIGLVSAAGNGERAGPRPHRANRPASPSD